MLLSHRRILRLAILLGWVPGSIASGAQSLKADLLSCERIWDAAPHCAFTDLVRFKDAWICVFREGQGHVSPDGAVRVIQSQDGRVWKSVARLESQRGDLRDPKVVLTPERRLMLTAAIAFPQSHATKHQTVAFFSEDGAHWTDPIDIGEANVWLWRVTWSESQGLGIGYHTASESFVRLYGTKDGRHFNVVRPVLFDQEQPNESSIIFEPNGRALCLLRRDGKPGHGLIGTAEPPYSDWVWKSLGMKIGGPHWMRLPNGRYVAAVRLYDGKVRTSLAAIDPGTAGFHEVLELPSGGDTSYAGLQWHDGVLWVSYYSSHEKKTAIYLARVRIEP